MHCIICWHSILGAYLSRQPVTLSTISSCLLTYYISTSQQIHSQQVKQIIYPNQTLINMSTEIRVWHRILHDEILSFPLVKRIGWLTISFKIHEKKIQVSHVRSTCPFKHNIVVFNGNRRLFGTKQTDK